jgi:DNA replication protein DnaC
MNKKGENLSVLEQRLERAHKLELARKKWSLVTSEIPSRFQENDTSLFPEVWNCIKEWKPRPEGIGILLVGDSGKCKTRMLCEIMMRLQDHTPTKFAFTSSAGFAGLVRRQFDFTDPGARTRIDYLRRVPVLIFDDLGKQNNSPTVEEEIFHLIDTRTSEMRSTLITANFNSRKEMETSMASDRGKAIARRILEFSYAKKAE